MSWTLDDPEDWDYADTQHALPSHSCEEAGSLVGAKIFSHAVYSSRKRRNRETQKRHAKPLKFADRVAKRKLMALLEISHAFAHAQTSALFLQKYAKRGAISNGV